jgi:hypothetical protein
MSKILAAAAIALLVSGSALANGWDNDGWDKGKDKDKDKKTHTAAAPEIDSASGAAALALLAGGLIVLYGRKTVKKD